MTACFGKLDNETLILKPGLNVIQAPNEWGKSTWCAFLTAMFYGLDTRAHTTKTALSDKERYAPWSGAPMSGRIDLNWNGRDITIERKSKGRTVFGDFRAYETQSGLPIPELTAQNCGQQLLGAEKSVFTRSAMIRQTDLPVTQDEALRRRLNALVTTGDDSGAAENLERRLRDLKNRCRYNRTGLLPQAEAEAAALDRKLRELDMLEAQFRKLRQRITILEENTAKLENHRVALVYDAACKNAKLFQSAEAELHSAEQALRDQEAQCAGLPPKNQAHRTVQDLQHLQSRWAQFRIEAEQPPLTAPAPVFHEMAPEEALEQAKADAARYNRLCKHRLWIPLLAFLILAIGIAVVLTASEYRIAGYAATATGILAVVIWTVVTVLRRSRAAKIAAPYKSRCTQEWIAAAQDYVNLCNDIQYTREQRQEALAALHRQTEQLCQGHPLPELLDHWQTVCSHWDALERARSEYERCRERLAVLCVLPTDAPMPDYPDDLSLTQQQTHQALADTARELRELQLRLGQCQGQMEAIGHRTALEASSDALSQRIRRLEDTYAALELAVSTLESARASLQRRFAPRIAARARDILHRLTDGRYERLVLDGDLTLQATAADEHTLRTALWRSDGTADLLYLSLRLAVAGELIPAAPLILDDALIRFDDQRLERAMSVLKEESSQRQILLFTCHSREQQYM